MKAQRSTRHVVPQALLVGTILVTAGLAGCTSPLRDSGRPSLLVDADWPPRITTGLEQLAANVPTLLLPEQDSETGSPVRIVRSAAYKLGLVLELDDADAEGQLSSAHETELVFVSFSPLALDERRPQQRPARLPGEITLGDLRAGVHWHLYEPKDGLIRGLVVHLGGNKYVRRALLADGWAVLSASNTGRCLHRRANPVSFEIERGEKLKQATAQIAAVFDDELADWPYSLEAVLGYLARHRPDVRQTPAAIMGFSIGAIALPAVVARLPDDFGAAVHQQTRQRDRAEVDGCPAATRRLAGAVCSLPGASQARPLSHRRRADRDAGADLPRALRSGRAGGDGRDAACADRSGAAPRLSGWARTSAARGDASASRAYRRVDASSARRATESWRASSA